MLASGSALGDGFRLRSSPQSSYLDGRNAHGTQELQPPNLWVLGYVHHVVSTLLRLACDAGLFGTGFLLGRRYRDALREPLPPE